MLKNYIKIAWKVLLRRKVFTSISLIGISSTLLILMLAVATVDQILTPARPGSRLERTIFATRIEFINKENGHFITMPSYSFLDRHVRTLTRPELVSIQSRSREFVSYVNGKRLDLLARYTDSEFWEIMQFDFVEGASFSKAAVENADHVAVITERTRKQYFGEESVVGKSIDVRGAGFQVLGVIKNEDIPFDLASADVFMPLTTSNDDLKADRLYGSYQAFVLARDPSDRGAIKEEFNARLDLMKEQDPTIEKLECTMGTKLEEVASTFAEDSGPRGQTIVMMAIILAMILFMLLPAVSLMSINVSRIVERSSEIGVRKSFGASSLTLVGQFVVENVIITLIGGVIGFVLSAIILQIVTNSGVFPFGHFAVNPRVFLYSLLICLFFGLFSGVYPAFRMSRMQPVEALRGGSL